MGHKITATVVSNSNSPSPNAAGSPAQASLSCPTASGTSSSPTRMVQLHQDQQQHQQSHLNQPQLGHHQPISPGTQANSNNSLNYYSMYFQPNSGAHHPSHFHMNGGHQIYQSTPI